jgi:hypothetical protein
MKASLLLCDTPHAADVPPAVEPSHDDAQGMENSPNGVRKLRIYGILTKRWAWKS